jgi:hypothetical protein
VRFIEEDELQRLLAQVPSSPRDNKILFNVYSVKRDYFNQVVPGELVISKLQHYHVMAGNADLPRIKKYFFSGFEGHPVRE